MPTDVLFILKRRDDFNPIKHNKLGLSTGLFNSASFVKDMLNEVDVNSVLEVVIDNNDIDREVTKYRPKYVIIEALWVVPTKFVILTKLHPNVKWIIRVHSELPFLAGEGMAMDWLSEYSQFPNIILAINAPRAYEEIKFLISTKHSWDEKTTNERIIYLPNYYPKDYKNKLLSFKHKDTLDICCFGAVRPLKNHILQAIAAIQFAESVNKKLNFHINKGRVEMKGEPVLRNLENMFEHLYDKGHRLIYQEWRPREEFLQVCAEMDIGMQVSISETFNIVGCDLISQGVPLVGSDEIPWLAHQYCAKPVHTKDIFDKLKDVYHRPQVNVDINRYLLDIYTNETKDIWSKYFKNL